MQSELLGDLNDTEKRVAVATVSLLMAKLDLRRVVRVFRALSEGEPLIPLQHPNAQLTLPHSRLMKTERYWAAATALFLHKELAEDGSARVITYLGRPHAVIESLMWFTSRDGRMRGGKVELPN